MSTAQELGYQYGMLKKQANPLMLLAALGRVPAAGLGFLGRAAAPVAGRAAAFGRSTSHNLVNPLIWRAAGRGGKDNHGFLTNSLRTLGVGSMLPGIAEAGLDTGEQLHGRNWGDAASAATGMVPPLLGALGAGLPGEIGAAVNWLARGGRIGRKFKLIPRSAGGRPDLTLLRLGRAMGRVGQLPFVPQKGALGKSIRWGGTAGTGIWAGDKAIEQATADDGE